MSAGGPRPCSTVFPAIARGSSPVPQTIAPALNLPLLLGKRAVFFAHRLPPSTALRLGRISRPMRAWLPARFAVGACRESRSETQTGNRRAMDWELPASDLCWDSDARQQ